MACGFTTPWAPMCRGGKLLTTTKTYRSGMVFIPVIVVSNLIEAVRVLPWGRVLFIYVRRQSYHTKDRQPSKTKVEQLTLVLPQQLRRLPSHYSFQFD